ncbi:MAG: hypothetical protein HOE27_01430 [Cryomorphaceae bacterium]|nr:hypothetical protein [Cryomorphaceae bacterium]
MFKQFLVFIFFFGHFILFSQNTDLDQKLKAQQEQEKLEKESENKKDTLTTDYYKIYFLNGKVESVDTSLNIYKDYKFNFLRDDSFDLISFANSGHTYNKLSYDLKNFSKPDIGARGKHFHYFEKEDIGYYNVPTPFTEIFAKSTFEQGQILDMLVSVNLSPQYNFTIAHKGYKSLGKYMYTRSRGNQFRLSSNFNSKNKLTQWRFHLTSQNIFNQETAGLDPDSIYFFEQATDYFILDDDGKQIINEDGSFKMIEYDGYLDRSRLGTLILAEGSLYSKRFFSDFQKILIKNKNRNILKVNYQFTHEYKKIDFTDDYNSIIFGEIDEGITVSDQSRFIEQENKVILSSDLNKIGKLDFQYSLTNWSNNFKTYDTENPGNIIYDLEENQSNISINWIKTFNKYSFEFNFNNSLKENFKSDYLSFNIKGNPIKNIDFELSSSLIEKSPNFNFILFRSAYKPYNWYNTELNNEKISNINLKISFKEFIVLTGDYNLIDNYTFFKESTNALTGETDFNRLAIVEQYNDEIKYYSLKLYSKVDLGKFSLVNTAKLQKKEQSLSLTDLSTINVPEWITRNTIMYSTNVFNNSLFIQTGITFNYFTKYYADYYNPLISEFVTQNYREIGEFPRFDFFFNAKIQQTRVFIKVEHLNSSFTGYDYYSDPFSPYRDMSIRLGLVWNFFS